MKAIERNDMRQILDITFPLGPSTTVWPGDIKVEIESVREPSGSKSMVSRLVMSSHGGTHVDAPAHFIEGGRTVESLSLDILIGECLVVEVEDIDITAQVVDALHIPKGTKRLIFKTSNSKRFSGSEPFTKDYVGISPCGAERLADVGVLLIGVDYLSAASYPDTLPVHLTLLGREIVLLETLNLAEVTPGIYELICLPLKLQGSDGSPCRAVLIRESL
jgi:arylformamidase